MHLVLASFPAAAASASETAAVADKYVPSPMDPTWQVGIEDDEDEVWRALAPPRARSPSYDYDDYDDYDDYFDYYDYHDYYDYYDYDEYYCRCTWARRWGRFRL